MKLQKKLILPFIILIILYAINTYFNQYYIFTEDYFNRSLSGQITESMLESMSLEFKSSWIGYLFLPFIIIIKILFVIYCLSTGSILANIDFQFKQILRAALYSEYIFVFSQFLFSINLFIKRDFITIENTANYFPLSMLSFWGVEIVATWLHYPPPNPQPVRSRLYPLHFMATFPAMETQFH